MLLLIIFVVLCIVGYCLNWLGKNSNWEALAKNGSRVMTFSFICVVICLVLLVNTKLTKQQKYETMQYEREVLVVRLRKEGSNIVGNENLFNDVVKFNNKLRRIKYGSKSKWVNIFYNSWIADLEYIDISSHQYENL